MGHTLEKIRLASPFLVRSFDPPIDRINGKKVVGLRRLGKRLIWQFEDDLFLIIHLMIAGRFKWATDTGVADIRATDTGVADTRATDTRATEGTEITDRTYPKVPAKVGLAAFDFDNGSLILTEAGGTITTLAGEPFTSRGRHVLASNGHLHGAMLEVIREDAARRAPERTK